MNEAASMSGAGSAAHSGLQLAAARQSCNLSVADVAHQLKLSPRQVEAMEAGEYQRLPGAVFVRGFIRNYARLVKLDPAPLVANVQSGLPALQPTAVTEVLSSPDIPFPSGRKVRWHKYAIGVLLAVAVLVVFEFYWSWTDTASEVTVRSRPVALPQATRDMAAANPVEQGAAAQVMAANEAAPRLPLTDAKPATRGGRAAADSLAATVTAPIAERKPGEHQVRLVFEKESWVEIRDRDGRKIFSRLNPPGSAQSVSGAPPLTLVVGNAAGVRLIHNDRPVNLAPHINVDVARLTLE